MKHNKLATYTLIVPQLMLSTVNGQLRIDGHQTEQNIKENTSKTFTKTTNINDIYTHIKKKSHPWTREPVGMTLISSLRQSARHQLKLQDHGHAASVLHRYLFTFQLSQIPI